MIRLFYASLLSVVNLHRNPLFVLLVSSHLTALGDDDVHIRDVLALVARLGGFHLLHDVHAVDHLAEHDVLAVEEGGGHRGDEELRAVGAGTGVLFADITR